MIQARIASRWLRYSVFVLVASTAPRGHTASVHDLPVGWASLQGGAPGGAGGPETTVDNLADLNAALKTDGKRVVWIKGTITGRVDMPTGDKSLLGLPGARLIGGIDLTAPSAKPFSNVVIRNFEIEGPGSNDVNGVDAVTVQNVSRVWIDHMWIHDGLDGNLDITNQADLVTVSWTRMTYAKGGNHAFCNLIGSSDSKTGDRGKLRITFLADWWGDGVVERMPRVRFGQVHLANCLFTSAEANYCVRAGLEADIRVQASAFIGVQNPIDLFEKNSKAVTLQDNFYEKATGDSAGSGTAFTPPYSLALLPAAQVKARVGDAANGAGPNLRWDGVTAVRGGGKENGPQEAGRRLRIQSGKALVDNGGTSGPARTFQNLQGRYLRVVPASHLNSK